MPVFVALLIYHNYRIALVVFISAALSDSLDGYLARRLGVFSEIGKLLDPIADKLLLIASFIVFTHLEWIPVWFTVIVLSRDLFIVIGWFMLYLIYDATSVSPTKSGKITIACQMFLVGYVLLERSIPFSLSVTFPLLALTAAVTILSGMQYIYKGLSYPDAA
ncbi:MAG: CDP-alcohol phosphatidyltransferase family protein [Nitrospirota bacterium]|nr:MAG: CDP-alcohol phosphatidyltransferase family protein [Nitrospirota bacterium]